MHSVGYKTPKAEAKAPPKVVKIYPTADVLPANHLKFYIYFDRPMRGGKELFNQIGDRMPKELLYERELLRLRLE